MLPCERREHLHKSAIMDFETKFENISNNYQNKSGFVPKWSKKLFVNHTQIMQKTSKTIAQNHQTWIASTIGDLSMSLSFRSQLFEFVPLWRVLFATCFSEPLGGGTPLDRCWPPLRHTSSDCFDFGAGFRSKFATKNQKIQSNKLRPSTYTDLYKRWPVERKRKNILMVSGIPKLFTGM